MDVKDIPKKTKKWPAKLSLNVDTETKRKWVFLDNLNFSPAELVREPVRKIISDAYDAVIREGVATENPEKLPATSKR